ncbi:MAG: PD40 domain-containing protein, partial [Acidobacteria bacterium]|nr:PD40 domain-containing protein [Acidobacteriota bacterium]
MQHLTAGLLLVALGIAQTAGLAQSTISGLQDPAWAPDGKRIAVSYLDQIWTMTPEGRQPRTLTPPLPGVQREPAWSADGSRIAFALSRGDGFDIVVASAKGGAPTAVTTKPGDERWPSWTPDGRIVFAHRGDEPQGRAADPSLQWDLYVIAPVAGSDAWQAPVALSDTNDDETRPRVSPDGKRVVFVSNRDSVEDVDLFAMPLPARSVAKPVPLGASVRRGEAQASGRPADVKSKEPRAPAVVRVTRVAGEESAPSWAPDSERIAFYAERNSVGSVWVAAVEPPAREPNDDPIPRPRPAAPPLLVSRQGGAPAWSPDGRTLLIAGLPNPQPVYNGNPLRNDTDALPLFATTRAFQLWRIAAPLPVHEEGGRFTTELAPSPALYTAAFNRAWQTLRDLYYAAGSASDAWTRAGDKYQPRAAQAKTEADLEEIIDAMVAEQPLVKPVVTSSGAVVVSGHPLASEAGRIAFEKGGNV